MKHECVFPVCSQVLNEVVVDRGPSSYLSNVDLFLDGHLITTVQGDGEWSSGWMGADTLVISVVY